MRVTDSRVTDDLGPAQMQAEDLMLGMRMTCGVSDARIEKAQDLLPGLQGALARLEQQGLIVHEDGRFRPTKLGWLCGNELYGALFDLA